MAEIMTKAERLALTQVVRLNTKVAITALKQRSAELEADLERKLAARFSYDQDEVWKQAYSEAKVAVVAANEKVAEVCRNKGIPAEFAPRINVEWLSRGQNASRERRIELRRVGLAEIEALERRGRAEIERRSAEIQTRLLAGGLETDDARAFLESIPSAVDLMPLLSIEAIEAAA
ncbi:hypothetical protein AAII07_54300 [Microvirga sp. 0TCS3.31]